MPAHATTGPPRDSARAARKSSPKTLATVVSGDTAYTVAIERSVVRLVGQEQPAAMALRVTHIFRKEPDDWKLVLRHADPSDGEDRASDRAQEVASAGAVIRRVRCVHRRRPLRPRSSRKSAKESAILFQSPAAHRLPSRRQVNRDRRKEGPSEPHQNGNRGSTPGVIRRPPAGGCDGPGQGSPGPLRRPVGSARGPAGSPGRPMGSP